MDFAAAVDCLSLALEAAFGVPYAPLGCFFAHPAARAQRRTQ